MLEDKLYTVTIKEVSEREVQVYAESADNAKDLIKQMYHDEKIVLDSNDLMDTEFLVGEIN